MGIVSMTSDAVWKSPVAYTPLGRLGVPRDIAGPVNCPDEPDFPD
jgi:hypothetical protein